MGAGVATIVGGTIPDRVTHLLLIDGLGPLSRPPATAPALLLKSSQEMKALSHKKTSVYQNFEQAVAVRMKVNQMEESSMRTLLQRGVIEVEEGITWRSDPRLTVTSRLYMMEDQILAFIDAITAPVLLIKAEKTVIPFKELLEVRFNHVKHLDYQELPGHHHLHLDSPQPVADAINAFFEKHSP